ncbi:hypothetical protein I6A60_05515 [Frankia sp. AgB1.9]|nr:hypothetical protein [Frankia sp. AgW1.1]MBL7547340.1 hypothetical protein [Frankia sp. AgB1.9]MBL7618739.1 VOC family protein [Frankia sp. AgB1.8]
MAGPALTLVVLYCSDITACREFYESLGLTLDREQHGTGPVHFAARTSGGAVLELYPADQREPTNPIRIGLTVERGNITIPLSPGNHVLEDPDGRRVAVTVTEQTGRAND